MHCNADSPLHISGQKINKKKITDYVLDLNSSYRYAPSGNTAAEKPPCTQHTRALHSTRLYASGDSDGHVVVRRDQQPSRPHIVFLFQVRFRLIRLPVVRKPLSPMAPRHSIDNWPRVARPSRRRSFCRASMPSVRDSSCSIRKATWRTSRGLRVGGFAVEGSEDVASQLRDWHLKGGLGLSRVCLGVLADGSIFCFQISASFCVLLWLFVYLREACLPLQPPHRPPHSPIALPRQTEATESFHTDPVTCFPLPKAAIQRPWCAHSDTAAQQIDIASGTCEHDHSPHEHSHQSWSQYSSR